MTTPDRYRIEEDVFVPGDPIYALGFLHQTNDFLNKERAERLQREVTRLKSSSELMNRLDKNGDGNVDQSEWTVAIDKLKRLVTEEIQRSRGTSVLGAHPQHFYILSNWHENTLLSQLAIFGWLNVCLGAALTIGASCYLISQLNF